MFAARDRHRESGGAAQAWPLVACSPVTKKPLPEAQQRFEVADRRTRCPLDLCATHKIPPACSSQVPVKQSSCVHYCVRVSVGVWFALYCVGVASGGHGPICVFSELQRASVSRLRYFVHCCRESCNCMLVGSVVFQTCSWTNNKEFTHV